MCLTEITTPTPKIESLNRLLSFALIYFNPCTLVCCEHVEQLDDPIDLPLLCVAYFDGMCLQTRHQCLHITLIFHIISVVTSHINSHTTYLISDCVSVGWARVELTVNTVSPISIDWKFTDVVALARSTNLQALQCRALREHKVRGVIEDRDTPQNDLGQAR
jgi:hypothetical protein